MVENYQLVDVYSFSLQNLDATFTFGSGYIYEEKTALRYTDVFINCSVDPIDAYTFWYFKDTRIFNDDKYSQNISGLTIYNVTEEDQGHYICFLGDVDPLDATIWLNIFCKLLNSKFYAYIPQLLATSSDHNFRVT